MVRRLGTFLSALLVFGATSLTGGVPADAAITPSSTAQQIATAISTTGNVTGTFVSKPPSGTPDAVADSGSALTPFPTHGTSYGILTTGDASQAANAPQSNFASASDGGGNVRGTSDYDVTILKVDLTAAANQTCLHVDFRFLSEEFPEFVGTSYNDAFIAELDTSNWTTSGSTIDAPNNFAFDPGGDPITINSTGATHMTAAEAAGTVYDGATQPLVAQTPITAGPHSVYFSIFDAGDQVYDSAVFLDNLFLGTESGDQCLEGAKPNLALSLTVNPSSTPSGITGVSLNQIPPTGIVQQTAPTQDAPIGKSPIGKSPIGKSPIGKSPIGKSPIGKSPIGKSPIGKSPIGKSPIGKSPIGKSPVSAFPLLRPGGWQQVLADSCDFQTAVPQGVTLAQLLGDSCATGQDTDPGTFPEFSAGSGSELTLDQINWAFSPAANASMLALLLGDVTWNDVTGTDWCAERIVIKQPACGLPGLGLPDPIIVTESNGLNIELTSLPVKTVNDITSPSTKTFFWGISVIDLNILGSFLGGVEIGDIPSPDPEDPEAVRSLFVDCANEAVDCSDESTQTLGDVFNLDPNNLTYLKPDGTLGDLGMGILGQHTLSDITIAFLDPNAINWEDVPLSGMGLESLDENDPTNLLQYTLSYEVPCADSSGMQATVKLPSGFLYRPGSSTPFEPASDDDGVLVWDLPSCSGSGAAQVQIDFQVMPGFSLGTFTSDASVKTTTTSALLEEAAPVTVNDGFVGNGMPGEAASVSGNAMFVGHLTDPGQQAFFSFEADPGDQVSVSLSHLSRDYDLVLYAPAGAQEADLLRSTTPPFIVPLGKAPLPDPLAGSGDAESLVPEALQDVPLVPDRVVAGISDFRGTEQEYITTTGVSGNDGNTYLVQVSENNSANGPEPFVLTIRTSTPDALPDCSPRTFPNTTLSLDPLDAPVIGADDNTLVIADQSRLEAAFGTDDAMAIMSKLQDLVSGHVDDTGVQGKVLDLSFFSQVNTAFGTADTDPCSPATNNNVVRAINDVVDELKATGDFTGLRNIVLVGEDDIIPHARILDGTTDGNERQFAGDTYFTGATNQLGGAFGNGYFLSDTPYASLQPLSILGQTVYPMQVALGRLGGSARTIEATIDLFVASKGLADPQTATSDPRTALETDYDFFRDGGALIHQSQASQVGAANAQRLTDAPAPWDKTDLTGKLLINVRDEGDETITSADTCLDGCFFGHDVVDGALVDGAVNFSGGFSPTIFGSLADLDGDGSVDGADDSNEFYGATSIIDGALDCDDWGTNPNDVNEGAAGDGTIDGDDDCTLVGYDGNPDGVTIEVVNGEFQTGDGPLPTVFPNVGDEDNPSVVDAKFAWSATDGKVDANGDGTIDGDDCHFGLIGQADDVGLGDPIDGVDILGTGCGFAGAIDSALNGLVDMNIGATPPDVISPNAHYDQYRLLPAKQDANGSWRAQDLFTTQNIERISGTPFKLRLLYGIGCHFGLDFPDLLAGNSPTGTDAQRILDWEQVYFEKGAAVLVGNLGFGFGDTATVAFSEQLMANFAANLDGNINMSVGQALVEAEKDYLTSLASFSPYDQKVLEQTIMWGFPMYKLPGGGGGSGPAAGSAVSSIVDDPAPDSGLGGVDATTVNLEPTFTQHTAPDGSLFYDADGLTQSTHPYPVMPKTVTDLPAGGPNQIAKGALLKSGTISEESNFDVTFANATIDNSANEPATAFETVYPTTHQSIGTFVDQTGSPTQTLVVLPGMFRPDADPTNSPSIGTFRKLETSQWQVTYGDPDDTTGPQFVSIEGTPGSDSTEFSVNVAENDDEVVVVRVAALLLEGNTYQTVDLDLDPDTTLWTGSLESGQVREFTVFALDSEGNVATANNRGIAYAPVDDTPPSIDFLIGDPKFESGGDTYVSSSTPITVTVSDLGSEGTCTIEVFGPQNSTEPCDVDNEFTLPDPSGAYTVDVTATDGAGNTSELSFDLIISGPTITITSPVEGATYELKQVVFAESSCGEAGFGVASCTKDKQNGEAIDTATIGKKTFTVTATDSVGNVSTKTVTYYVGYKVCLQYDPTKPFRINTSTIPIKLTICDATGKNLSSASLTLTAVSLKNVTTGVITSPPPVNAGDGFLFRFDKNLVKPGGGYIYNLSTKGLPANNTFELRFAISNEAAGTALHVAPFSTKP
jgi:hypothetical protein